MPDRSRPLSDNDLFAALAASFPVEPAEPDAASLHRLSLAVAALRTRTAPAGAAAAAATASASASAAPKRWSLPRRLSPLVLAGSVIGVVGAGTGISFAVGAPIPAAVRSIARTVGLDRPATPATLPPATTPATSAAVSAARQAESNLHQALAESDPPPSVISHDSSVLAHRLVQVGGEPGAAAAGAAADGHHLLNEACGRLEGSGPAGADTTTGTGTTTGPATSTGTTHAGWSRTTFPSCGPVGVGRNPPEPTNPSAGVPTTTRTTELPSASHPGAGTHGGPVKAPVEGSTGSDPSGSQSYPSGSQSYPSGSHSGGTPTDGSKGTTPETTPGTTPGTNPDHSSGGSPGGHGGSGTSTGFGGQVTPTTNPRTSATPPTD